MSKPRTNGHAAPRSLPHAKHQPGLTSRAKARKHGRGKGTTRVPKRKGQRKIQIDIDSCRPLIALGVSNETIADCLGISAKTLQTRLAENAKLRSEFDRLKGERKRNVYAWLTRAASQGNARVLLHLAAHELGQTPVRSIELSGPNGGPIEVNREMQPLLERKLAEFIRSKREVAIDVPSERVPVPHRNSPPNFDGEPLEIEAGAD